MTTGFTTSRLKPALLALGVTVSLLSLLSGCDDEKTRNLINQRADESEKSVEQMAHQAPNKRYNPLVVTDRVWTGSTATRMHRGLPLPGKYETPHGITLVSSEPMSLNDIAAAVGAQTGIPVRVADGGGKPMAVATPGSSTVGGMPLAYEGSLSGLMERLSGYFGVNWRYDGATITISRYETRVFVIEALPGTQNVQEGMQDDTSSSGSSGGASGSSGGSSSSTNSMTQNSKFSIDFKYWDELGQIVTSMLGGNGSIVVSPSVGTVTVTTTPEIMHTIADYLANENQRLSRQIAISVEIYSVTLTEGMDFNVAFGTLLRRLTNFGANFDGTGLIPPTATISGATSGGGALSVAILNPNIITQAGITHPVGQITDVLTALSGIGDTSKVAKFPLVTLNNRPVSRRVGEDISYVASATSSNLTSGATTSAGTSLTPGTVHQGFSVQLTPRLLDDGRILMQYSLSVVDVKDIKTFNSICGDTTNASSSSLSSTCSQPGTTSIQSPDTVNRIFVQQSVLKSGSTLVLGGAEEEDLQQNSQGVGNPYNYLLGGGVNSAKSHTMLIMAITPQVLDVPHSEND